LNLRQPFGKDVCNKQWLKKYKINKDVYTLKHNGAPVNEYYTKMQGVWKELSSMNDLQRFTNLNRKITNLLDVLAK